MKIIAAAEVRLNSKRCKRKMTRPFANTTLVEIAAKRLADVKNFDGVYFGAHEDELLEAGRKYLPSSSMRVRTKEMANTDDMMLARSWIRDIDFDYCMLINSCHGNLESETLDQAVEIFRRERYKSMTAVTKRYSWYYNQDGEPVNNKDPLTQAGTHQSEPLYEVAHAFHLFQKEHFFSTKSYWNNKKNDPFLYVINDIEALDVDTEEEFVISESVFKSFHP
jgi:CMP-N-acetylneuraminic acid synthetase